MATIHPIILSDHVPIEVGLEWNLPKSQRGRWYFPHVLTRDSTTRDELRRAIREFFQSNQPGDTPLPTIWDAFKAVIRGTCISSVTSLYRLKAEERLGLENALQEAERAHKLSPTWQNQRKVTSIKGKLQSIYMNRAEVALLRLQRPYYDGGNKISSLLARQLRVKQSKGYIAQVRDESCGHHSEEEKACAFRNFYTCLYTSDNPSATAQERYLCHIQLPQVYRDTDEFLEAPFTLDKVREAIDSLPLHKARVLMASLSISTGLLRPSSSLT
ncbi:hypothetical protein NDU88_001686 [Pleurodeles waltl]|uniref:Reverse transcriptase n=1 Tax=Pleurodeles waltl TaxID=8319 RepID=A0AAV7UTJ2_PLEWA|nr:hypothetical protein NDU88_001686 [Pleurodeles waltl]